MSSEHFHSRTNVQRTQTLHHPHTITTHHRQQQYLKRRNNSHTQIHDVLYTRFGVATNTNKENSLELQTLGSRDTNTELPHKASYWITLLTSLHSAVKPA